VLCKLLLNVHVCMYVCMYVCIYVFMCVYVQITNWVILMKDCVTMPGGG